MLPEYMTIGELESEADRIRRERAKLPPDTPDEQRDQLTEQIEHIEGLILKKRSL